MTAIKMFATHGFAATSIRNLAAEAEVHIGSVGHYFGGKDQLFWTARRHAINKLERETSELHPDSEEGGRRVLHSQTQSSFEESRPPILRQIGES